MLVLDLILHMKICQMLHLKIKGHKQYHIKYKVYGVSVDCQQLFSQAEGAIVTVWRLINCFPKQLMTSELAAK